ncbi:uncharacterized protein [Lepeophtheirus salmonis]
MLCTGNFYYTKINIQYEIEKRYLYMHQKDIFFCQLIVRHGCDSLSTENITYFTSPQTNNVKEPNICRLQICPCGANICQLRLDFISFAILPPDNGNSGVIGRILNGAPTSKANGLEVTSSTRCNSESFSVSNPGGTTPPVICGMNDGYHMYVDTNSNCNDLTFLLDGSSDNSNWLIKVTQYDCFYSNLAPSGCTQWFFGPLTNDVTSFNYQGGLHLANQDQRICVRREANTCQICWTTSDPLDFQLSGPGTMALTDDNICCNYDFNLKLGFDCLIIPTATSFANEKQLNANYFCGASKGLGAVGSRTAANTGIVRPNSLPNKSICSRSLPFSITFRSDNYEFMEESAKSPKGFRLFYILNKCS